MPHATLPTYQCIHTFMIIYGFMIKVIHSFLQYNLIVHEMVSEMEHDRKWQEAAPKKVHTSGGAPTELYHHDEVTV